MVGIGIAGIGFMGMIHDLAARRTPGCKVVAIQSRDPRKRAGDWTGIKGNFGPAGSMRDMSGTKAHAAFKDLLADPDVDLVDLCVPNDQHADLAVQALEAGKHVLVEKPIALSVEDADRMLAASKASGRLLMVAHVLPFFPEFAFALEAVRSGRFGKLQAAHLTRVISKPDWSSGISDAERSGGPAIDLHIHDTHYLTLLAGTPEAVHSRGVVEQGAVVHLTTQYLYEAEDAPALSSVSGALCQKGRPFAHGFEIYLEQATISLGIADVAGQGPVNPLVVILPDGSVQRPEIGAGDPIDAFSLEIAEAVQAVASGVESQSLSGLRARQALATCWAEVTSVKERRSVPIPA